MTDEKAKQMLLADLKIKSAELMQNAKLSQYVAQLYNGNNKQCSDAYEEYMLSSAELLNAHNAKVKLYGLENL